MSGCSLLFSAGNAETDAGTQDAVVVADATWRNPTDPQFATCGRPLVNFGQRTQVFINYTSTPTLSDYPLLVPIPSDVMKGLSLRSDIADLRFADGAGNELSYEIELFDVEATSYIWVQVNLGSALCQRSIWVYSDNPTVDQDIPIPTWPSTLAMWHFATNDGDQINSSSADFIASPSGSQTLSFVGNGAMGVAQKNGRFTVKTTTTFSLPAESTWETRFYITNSEIENQRPLDFFSRIVLLATRNNSGQDKDFRISAGFVAATTMENNVFLPSDEAITEGWHYMALVIETVTSQQVSLYIDGVHKGANPIVDIANVQGDTATFFLGLPSGYIDEARISTIAHSDDWIANNQKAFEGELIEFGETDRLSQ